MAAETKTTPSSQPAAETVEAVYTRSLLDRIAEEGRFGLRALVGGGMLALLSESGTSQAGAIGSMHYGGAFSVETRRAVSVRLQALHVISVARDAGYAHCLELTIGVVTRLGRRDRWK